MTHDSSQAARILLLGATGSIGTSACNCIRRLHDRFSVTGVSANRNIERLRAQIDEFDPQHIHIGDPGAAAKFRQRYSDILAGRTLYEGVAGLEEIVHACDCDIVINALVGAVGLRPTAAALKKGRTVALANKESLVIGGSLINRLLQAHGGRLLPLDSEHSAILQCLQGTAIDSVESVLITASGGPFREMPTRRFSAIRPQDALKHPTWAMGQKITIDSATLMNKGFELIEAHFLFGFSYRQLRVLIHPQSIIHSIVEFHDGGLIAQMGVPDMELPIQYALTFPERMPIDQQRLNLTDAATLTFFEPDYEKFPCLRLSLEAAEKSDACRIALNAANEMAVTYFLSNKIGFTDIPRLVETACEKVPQTRIDSVEDIEETDRYIRQRCKAEWLGQCSTQSTE